MNYTLSMMPDTAATDLSVCHEWCTAEVARMAWYYDNSGLILVWIAVLALGLSIFLEDYIRDKGFHPGYIQLFALALLVGFLVMQVWGLF